MTLRVQDLKPGDVVRLEVTLRDTDHSWAMFNAVGDCDLCDEDLAAMNAELVVRPRPVRKGDEVRHRTWESDAPSETFLALHLGRVVTYGEHGLDSYVTDGFTHADGSPIDWEASE